MSYDITSRGIVWIDVLGGIQLQDTHIILHVESLMVFKNNIFILGLIIDGLLLLASGEDL
jgi:hypothetical protein